MFDEKFIYIYIYAHKFLYVYIYICHPQTDCFIVSQLFSVARHIYIYIYIYIFLLSEDCVVFSLHLIRAFDLICGLS